MPNRLKVEGKWEKCLLISSETHLYGGVSHGTGVEDGWTVIHPCPVEPVLISIYHYHFIVLQLYICFYAYVCNGLLQSFMYLWVRTGAEKKQPISVLFNPLAPHVHFRVGRLLGAFRMRHEKHTQSSNISQALVLPNNAVAAVDSISTPLDSHLVLKLTVLSC